MHSRTIRYGTAAVVLVAVYLVIHAIAGSGNVAGVALGRVREAIAKVPWIHVQTQIESPEQKRQIDEWLSFGEQIEIRKEQDGAIRYRDEGRGTSSVYDPAGNTITISSLSDNYAAPRRVPMPASSAEVLEQIDKLSEGGKRTVTTGQLGERPVEIIHTTKQLTDDVAAWEEFTLVVDAQSKLPISMDATVTREDRTLVAKMYAAFDYPTEGPRDLYSLGVPQDARVIDRRPDPNAAAKARIRTDFATDPGDPNRQVLLLSGAVNIDFVRIPPGEFLMGSPDTEIGYPAKFLERFGDRLRKKYGTLRPTEEGPRHLVKIARGFYMSKCEITCAQFRAFRPEFRRFPYSAGTMEGKRVRLEMDLDELPACVSLNDAKAFCGWLAEKTGLTVRLPSEAEWEYACRAGTQTCFFWGDAIQDAGRFANFADKTYGAVQTDAYFTPDTHDGQLGPAPAGSYLPNHFGLYDMLGNASEWVVGIYSANAFSIDPENKRFDPNTEENQQQYCRGGAYGADISSCRCASRSAVPKEFLSDSDASLRIIIEEK